MRIGVIGGSGVYHMDGLTDVREEVVTTPWGAPSDALIHGRLGDVELVFLPRHGRGHRFNPSEVNYRANIFALKQADRQRRVEELRQMVERLQAEVAQRESDRDALVDAWVERVLAGGTGL